MITQYPHSVTVTTIAPSTQDGVGDYQPTGVAATTIGPLECRAEPAGSNPLLKGPDGDDLTYDWIVYMPPLATELTFGYRVTITMQNGSTFTGSLKRQSNGQFNTRLWV